MLRLPALLVSAFCLLSGFLPVRFGILHEELACRRRRGLARAADEQSGAVAPFEFLDARGDAGRLAAHAQDLADPVQHRPGVGELGLDGRVHPVRGVLPAVAAAVPAGPSKPSYKDSSDAASDVVPPPAAGTRRFAVARVHDDGAVLELWEPGAAAPRGTAERRESAITHATNGKQIRPATRSRPAGSCSSGANISAAVSSNSAVAPVARPSISNRRGRNFGWARMRCNMAGLLWLDGGDAGPPPLSTPLPGR